MSDSQTKLVVPIHPFFAALVPLFLYYNTQAAQEMPVDELIVPAIAVLLTTTIVYGLLGAIVFALLSGKGKTVQQRAIFTVAAFVSMSWTIFFSLTYCIVIHGLFEVNSISVNFLGEAARILPFVWFILLAPLVIPVFNKSWSFKMDASFHSIFLLFFLIQVGAMGWNFFQDEVVTANSIDKTQEKVIVRPAILTAKEVKAEKPDIYYIILDQMAGLDGLYKLGYDDAWFYDELEKRGFYVARKSLSNYPITRLSISSSLNMNYLDSFTSCCNDKNWAVTTPLMRNNALSKLLKHQGYKYVLIDSGVPPTTRSNTADAQMFCGYTDHFTEKFIRSTILSLIPETENQVAEIERKRVLQELDYLQNQEGKTGSPLFVFSHILCPHEPYIFGKNGEPVFFTGERCGSHWSDETKAAYLAQAEFIQKKILVTLDNIIKKNPHALIVLQGDHGTHCSEYLADQNPSIELLKERYSILNAYRVPEQIRAKLSNDIQPVNSFRLILSQLFGYKLAPLPQKQYYASYNHPLAISDVTEKVR